MAPATLTPKPHSASLAEVRCAAGHEELFQKLIEKVDFEKTAAECTKPPSAREIPGFARSVSGTREVLCEFDSGQ